MGKTLIAHSIAADSQARRVSPAFAYRLVIGVLAALLILVLPGTLFGQMVVELEWLQQFGTIGPALDTAQAVDVDADGNTYVAGSTDATFPGQTSAGGTDAYVRKYDASGNEVWTRQFGTRATDRAAAIAVNSSGVYVAGFTGFALPGQTAAGFGDAFVRKYDASGNEVWTRQFGSATTDEAQGLAADATGVSVVGRTDGALPGQTSSGGSDAFVRNFDVSGNLQWTRQFGTSAFDSAFSVSADGIDIYVVGRTMGILPGQTAAGDSDAFLRKYDATGNEVWTRQFGSTLFDQAFGVSADGVAVYVAGSANGVLLPGYISLGTDAFVRKYDTSGTALWTSQFGTMAVDRALSVSSGASGVYVTGRTDGALPGQTHAGGPDVFVRKYDPSGGVVVWTRQFGSSADDQGLGISARASSVFVAGFIGGTLPGQTGSGSTDAFLREYDAAGEELWTRQFGTIGPVTDLAQAVGVNGDVYVAGVTDAALPGQTHAGGSDAFVRKYDVNGNEVWTRQFGTPAVDQALSISLDASGVYVAGRTEGALGAPPLGGGGDAFVRKYDLNGNELWIRQFGTAGGDSATAIFAHTTGIYVAGTTGGTLPGQTHTGSPDAFLRAYDVNGTEVWTHQFGTSAIDAGQGVSADSSGVYIAGRTDGTFTGQPSAGGADAFVRKLDVSGNALWTRQFGTAAFDAVFGVSTDGVDVYVAGRTDGVLPDVTGAGNGDAFVRKYDGSGNEVWTRQFGTSAFDQAFGVSADASGVYVAGQVNGTLPGQVSAGGTDAFARRYDFTGGEVWTLQFGTSSVDQAFGISVNPSGVYVAGRMDASGIPDAFLARLLDDTVPPATTITTQPASVTNDATGDFTFASNELGSTFECRVDAGAFAACLSPFSTLTLADGSHTFEVRATDLAGNTDATPAAYTWTVDTVPPARTITTQPASVTNDATGNFTFASNELGSTFACRVDAGAFAACASPFSTAVLADGSHTFEVQATDPAGNTDATPAAYTWTVDTVAPATTITSQPASVTNDATGDFTFASNELGSTFACRVDAGAFAACTSPFSTAVLADGSHIFEVQATDPAGNTDATPAAYTWTVFLPVAIDIKPGTFPNSINLGSGGTVPVAIFSSTLLDATTVNPSSVTLASAPVQLRGNGTPMASTQDVNGDGLLDLVVHVSTGALQLINADTEAVLEGTTVDGKRIRGGDTIRVVP